MANVITFMENVTNSLGVNSTEDMEAMDFEGLIASANKALDDDEDDDDDDDWGYNTK